MLLRQIPHECWYRPHRFCIDRHHLALERYPDLESRLAEAREQARQKALAGIKAAGEAGDWRALECFLKMSFQDYRDKGTQVQVNTGPQLVCDEETRKRLQALRAEILGPPKKVEAIEVEAHPSGLLAPIETWPETFKPAEPESEAELALREKKIQEESSWQQQEPECYIEPSGADHPAVRRLGLGPK